METTRGMPCTIFLTRNQSAKIGLVRAIQNEVSDLHFAPPTINLSNSPR